MGLAVCAEQVNVSPCCSTDKRQGQRRSIRLNQPCLRYCSGDKPYTEMLLAGIFVFCFDDFRLALGQLLKRSGDAAVPAVLAAVLSSYAQSALHTSLERI